MKAKAAVSASILLVTTLLLILLSPEPAASVRGFFSGPFRNLYSFGSFLASASLLTIAGTGAALAFRGGAFNLGGEGQVYCGAVSALSAGLLLPALPGNLGTPLLLLAAAAAGFFIALFSGWLKYRFSIHELISTYLISSTLVYICDYLISGPLRDEESFLIATPRLPEVYTLQQILPPSPLHTGVFIALTTALAAHLWLNRSVRGYRLRIYGENPACIRFAGIREKTYALLPIALSGGLYGLAGGVALLGIHFRGIQGFTAGLGWNGIAVALIAGLSPAAAAAAAVLIAFIEIGISAAMAGASVTYDLGLMIRGIILIMVTMKVFTSNRKEELL